MIRNTYIVQSMSSVFQSYVGIYLGQFSSFLFMPLIFQTVCLLPVSVFIHWLYGRLLCMCVICVYTTETLKYTDNVNSIYVFVVTNCDWTAHGTWHNYLWNQIISPNWVGCKVELLIHRFHYWNGTYLRQHHIQAMGDIWFLSNGCLAPRTRIIGHCWKATYHNAQYSYNKI